MSQVLMPSLSQRVLILTLCRVSDEEICVNVIPKPLKSDQRDDHAALTTTQYTMWAQKYRGAAVSKSGVDTNNTNATPLLGPPPSGLNRASDLYTVFFVAAGTASISTNLGTVRQSAST